MARKAPPSWDLEVDLVAIGSGLGGLAAAIVAHDHGASCAVLEKAAKLGGLSGFGGGEVFVPANEPMLALGLEDTREEGRQYYEFVAGGWQSQGHLDKLLDMPPRSGCFWNVNLPHPADETSDHDTWRTPASVCCPPTWSRDTRPRSSARRSPRAGRGAGSGWRATH